MAAKLENLIFKDLLQTIGSNFIPSNMVNK